ncbi:HepT-like ribonuclease domain-containing protein [Archaeoglobus neptunius]|uniref:HepT-like ribonuclease domain-containing protein n=1 Tax=Archaeoglobus neptunius TaxID=2798580 RepID=UPI002EDAA5B8
MKNISETLKEKYPEIAWKEIAKTRDKLIHSYFGVDLGYCVGYNKPRHPSFERTNERNNSKGRMEQQKVKIVVACEILRNFVAAFWVC